MTTQGDNGNLFLRDDQGNYYVISKDMLEKVKVPEQNKQEVEEVIGGKDDTAGYYSFAGGAQTFQASSLSLGRLNLNVLGRCNGDCGRSFGVLGRTQFQ